MAGNINKRQQVRNERALQDLLKSVPGNDRCAECAAKNPGWASWSLGIFLCIRCAALHRKLGTHISKVKSLSMDSWTNEQVENMKRVGNVINNKLYNPKNTRPSIPIDADEVDGAMERFIRQKYEHRTFQNISGSTSPGSRQHTGSTSSDDRPTQTATALPPKPAKRFNFMNLRSSSHAVSRSNTLSPPTSPGLQNGGYSGEPSPKDKQKHTKLLGAEVAGYRDDGFERKIQYLKDMGFPDEKRNAQVLKGLNGNVDKSVETLIRLGEGGGASESSSRGQLPTPQATPVNGLSVQRTRTPTAARTSVNPFDMLDKPNTNKTLPPPPPASPPPQQAYNPFMQQTQQHSQEQMQQPSIDQAFSGMSISQHQPQQTQPLFPHNTGGYGAQNPAAYNPFLQTAPPPVPQLPQQYSQFAAATPFGQQQQQQGYQQQQQLQQQPTGNPAPNPFLRTSRSQNFNPSNAFDTQGPFNAYSNNPIFNQTQQQTAPRLQPQPTANSYNPFQASNPPGQSVFGPSSPSAQTFGAANRSVSSPLGSAVATPTAGNNTSSFGNVSTAAPFDHNQNATVGSPYGSAGPVQQPSYFTQQPVQPFQNSQSPFAQQQQQQVPLFQSPSSAPPQQQSMFQPPNQQAQQQQMPQQQQQQFQPQPQQQQFQQQQNQYPVRQQTHDKGSILALYNMPHLAPQPTNVQDFTSQQQQNGHGPKRSATMPVGAMPSVPEAAIAPPMPVAAPNPFAALAPMARPNVGSTYPPLGISRESVDFAGLAMMGGRSHSPDAFSGLSAVHR